MYRWILAAALVAGACGGPQRRASLPCDKSIAARARGDFDTMREDAESVRVRDLYLQGCFNLCKGDDSAACVELALLHGDTNDFLVAPAIQSDRAAGKKAACDWAATHREVYERMLKVYASGEATTAQQRQELGDRQRAEHGSAPLPTSSGQGQDSNSAIDKALATSDSDLKGEGYHVVKTDDQHTAGDDIAIAFDPSPISDFQVVCAANAQNPFHGTATSGSALAMDFATIDARVDNTFVERVGFHGDINHIHVRLQIRPGWHNTPHRIACRIYER